MSQAILIQIERRSELPESEFRRAIVELDKAKWRGLAAPQVGLDGLTTSRAKNVITPVDVMIPECQTCGACCVFLLCVAVRPSDATPTAAYWDVTSDDDDADDKPMVVDRFLRRDGATGACASLGGKLGESVACGIYEQRPQPCRDFEAGSDKCHALRRAFGFEIPLSEVATVEANERINEAVENSAPQNDRANEDDKILYAAIVKGQEAHQRSVIAIMENGTQVEIHEYDARRETWMQGEFAGKSLAEVKATVSSRRVVATKSLGDRIKKLIGLE